MSQLGLLAVLVWLIVPYLFDHRLPALSLRRTATVMARKKATPDELEARAEANGYQRGRRTGKKTAVETGNKHEDKTKKNQDATLGHYVM